MDYSWYYRFADGLAYIRQSNSSGTSNNNVSDYTEKVFDVSQVYGINRVGNKVNFLINGVIVYTSSKNSNICPNGAHAFTSKLITNFDVALFGTILTSSPVILVL
jgi:hypothetical protein